MSENETTSLSSAPVQHAEGLPVALHRHGCDDPLRRLFTVSYTHLTLPTT